MVGQKTKTISRTSITILISESTSGVRSRAEAFRWSNFSQGESLRHLENKMKSGVVPGLGVLSEEGNGLWHPYGGIREPPVKGASSCSWLGPTLGLTPLVNSGGGTKDVEGAILKTLEDLHSLGMWGFSSIANPTGANNVVTTLCLHAKLLRLYQMLRPDGL